ncbi:MAG: hypothetical protein WCO00_06150 [Rhodospirillaceae bacterium]
MTDSTIRLAADGTGKYIDVSELTVGATTVERQRINISDPTSPTAIAAVKDASTAAAAADPALVVSVSPNTAAVPVTVNGQAQNSTAPVYSIRVSEDAKSINGTDGVIDALNRIMIELRQLTMFTKQLPLYLNLGIQITDDNQDFRDDPTNFSS